MYKRQVCAARQHAHGSSGTLRSSSVRFLLLWDALQPSCLCMWSPLIAFCRCPILSADLQRELDAQRAASGRPCCAPPLSPRIPKSPLLLFSPAPWCLGVLVGAGGLPRRLNFCSVCTRSDPYFDLGWGWVSLVYWHHLGSMCCGVIHVTGPRLMRVQRPGRLVAGCRSCRRVKLIAVVWCCWPALVG